MSRSATFVRVRVLEVSKAQGLDFNQKLLGF
jgi:hypothetical protein